MLKGTPGERKQIAWQWKLNVGKEALGQLGSGLVVGYIDGRKAIVCDSASNKRPQNLKERVETLKFDLGIEDDSESNRYETPLSPQF